MGCVVMKQGVHVWCPCPNFLVHNVVDPIVLPSVFVLVGCTALTASDANAKVASGSWIIVFVGPDYTVALWRDQIHCSPNCNPRTWLPV
jgi:hypothetical protein